MEDSLGYPVIMGKGMKMKNRMYHVFNKHERLRYSRKYELLTLLNYLMERHDKDYMFRFLSFNMTLFKEETDYLSEIYNMRLKKQKE